MHRPMSPVVVNQKTAAGAAAYKRIKLPALVGYRSLQVVSWLPDRATHPTFPPQRWSYGLSSPVTVAGQRRILTAFRLCPAAELSPWQDTIPLQTAQTRGNKKPRSTRPGVWCGLCCGVYGSWQISGRFAQASSIASSDRWKSSSSPLRYASYADRSKWPWPL